jgi:hypothetical protein
MYLINQDGPKTETTGQMKPSGLIKYIGLSAKELNGFVNTNIFRTRQILNFLKDGVNLGAV